MLGRLGVWGFGSSPLEPYASPFLLLCCSKLGTCPWEGAAGTPGALTAPPRALPQRQQQPRRLLQEHGVGCAPDATALLLLLELGQQHRVERAPAVAVLLLELGHQRGVDAARTAHAAEGVGGRLQRKRPDRDGKERI